MHAISTFGISNTLVTYLLSMSVWWLCTVLRDYNLKLIMQNFSLPDWSSSFSFIIFLWKKCKLNLMSTFKNLCTKPVVMFYWDLCVVETLPSIYRSCMRNLIRSIVCVTGTEVFSLPSGAVSINKKLMDISEQLKPYIRDLIDHSNTVSIPPSQLTAHVAVFF